MILMHFQKKKIRHQNFMCRFPAPTQYRDWGGRCLASDEMKSQELKRRQFTQDLISHLGMWTLL